MPTPTRALVIGGSGFIGLHVVDVLLERGWTVSVTRRKSTPTMLLRRRPVTLVEASLDDRASLERAMAGCDVVAVCGGYYPRYSTDRATAVRTGVDGVENALQAAWSAGVRRVLYTSSVAVLGKPPVDRPADERDVGAPGSDDGVYTSVKREMERRVDAWRDRGMGVVSLVTGGCMGPGDLRLGTTGILVMTLRSALPFWVDGWVNLVDVRDVARGHVAAIDSPGARYCLGGRDIRMGALLSCVAERYGVPLTAPEVSPASAREQADAAERAAEPNRARVAMPRELVDVVCDGQRVSSAAAERDLGLTWTPLETSLDDTHAWLLSHGYLKLPRRNEPPA
jgi:dihydroflavonol-4-reductase